MLNKNRIIKNPVHSALFAGSFILSSLTGTGCGKTAFTVNPNADTPPAAGSFSIPPKIDFILAQNDKASMAMIYDSVNSGVKSLLQQMGQQKWDFHFTTVPLTTYQPLQQVVGSTYDGNSNPWTPPYPLALQFGPGMLSSTVFRTLDNYTGFLSGNSFPSGGFEAGFQTIQQVLSPQGLGASNFLRPDALTVILVVSNGNDTSLVNYNCPRQDGATSLCTYNPAIPTTSSYYVPVCTPTATDPTGGNSKCDSTATSLAYFQNYFKTKVTSSQVQLYSAVAQTQADSNYCLGRSALVGDRYMSMATATGGANYNVCTTPIPTILSDLSTRLQAQKVNYLARYLFFTQEPDPKSISITKYIGGASDKAQVIPQSATDGWTYEGLVQNVYVLHSFVNGQEIQLNQASGYAVRLHGSYELSGADTSKLTYMPMGANSAVSQ